ncbi:hemerythrin domain-containing protein [Sphingopyxis panaciterrulae]|uniref:Hemerythrin-like domain-containing protein n=1 Tax=Sphingopyxis panaciterrulae TaxID=462372 RepID=A0A7W9B3K1_9SPHN|nr:hemerythrin domain-containing protein [Sphingopyxis panaciterrulae]MBB5705639.1 hypothetical protein [Sphingopyxis panaciterrulae]
MRRLRAEHSDLAMLGKAMCALVAAPEPPPNDEIEALRARLRDTLVRHLKCEDWALYPRLAASGDPALAELASRFAAEVGGIGLRFAEYDADWSSERVAADWPRFCDASRGMIEELAGRIVREERDLYPAAEALGDIGPPAARRMLLRAGADDTTDA